MQSVNEIVFKECTWDPNQDPEKLLARVAVDQFGSAAAEKMSEAWKEVKAAFETISRPGTVWWSTYLMTGNLAAQFGMFRPLTIEGLQTNPNQYYSGPSPTSHAHFRKEYRNPESLAQLEEACTHMRRAADLAKDAIPFSPDDRRPFYSYFYFPRRDLTCRRYAQEQYHSINFNRYIFDSNANFIRAELLVREGKLAEARAVIDRENAMTEEVLRTSAAFLAAELGLLHDCAARLTPYAVLGDQHPVIEKLRRKLAPAVPAQRKRLEAPFVQEAPTLDGVLNEPVWQRAAKAEEFTLLGSPGRAPQAGTQVRVYRDPDFLYIAFECAEPKMQQLVARRLDRDAPVYDDDCVEVYLIPDPSKEWFHLAVNAVGSRYDDRGTDASWNGEWDAACAKSDTGWTAEIRIPFSTIGAASKSGSVWRVNFNRQRKAGTKELSGWSQTLEFFGEPDRFGEMVFR